MMDEGAALAEIPLISRLRRQLPPKGELSQVQVGFLLKKADAADGIGLG